MAFNIEVYPYKKAFEQYHADTNARIQSYIDEYAPMIAQGIAKRGQYERFDKHKNVPYGDRGVAISAMLAIAKAYQDQGYNTYFDEPQNEFYFWTEGASYGK